MKYVIVHAVVIAALLATASAQAQTVPQYLLTYNAADGSLTIDTFGNPLYNYVIDGTGELGTDDGFIEANHILIPDAPGPELSSFTSTDDELSQSDFNGWFGLGPQNLGDVLPAGLSESQFRQLINPLLLPTTAFPVEGTFYVRELGTLGDPDFFYPFDIVYNVPEPSSIVIFGIGAAMLAQRRRRR